MVDSVSVCRKTAIILPEPPADDTVLLKVEDFQSPIYNSTRCKLILFQLVKTTQFVEISPYINYIPISKYIILHDNFAFSFFFNYCSIKFKKMCKYLILPHNVAFDL